MGFFLYNRTLYKTSAKEHPATRQARSDDPLDVAHEMLIELPSLPDYVSGNLKRIKELSRQEATLAKGPVGRTESVVLLKAAAKELYEVHETFAEATQEIKRFLTEFDKRKRW